MTVSKGEIVGVGIVAAAVACGLFVWFKVAIAGAVVAVGSFAYEKYIKKGN